MKLGWGERVWHEETEEHSGYYEYSKDEIPRLTYLKAYTECVTNREGNTDLQEENVRRFNEFFGKGEFPFITITVIRLGNKDHYFYTIHR